MTTCPECGETFTPYRKEQRFCRPKHRKTFHHRRESRCREIYDDLYRWRRDREGFAQISRKIDRWIREDREAGRVIE